MKNVCDVNEARLTLFNKAYICKDTNDVFKITNKNVDASILLSCNAELKKQLQRAAYIPNIWSHTDQKVPIAMIAEENGWQLIDGRYDFSWYEGDQLSNFIYDVLIQPRANSTGCIYW